MALCWSWSSFTAGYCGLQGWLCGYCKLFTLAILLTIILQIKHWPRMFLINDSIVNNRLTQSLGECFLSFPHDSFNFGHGTPATCLNAIWDFLIHLDSSHSLRLRYKWFINVPVILGWAELGIVLFRVGRYSFGQLTNYRLRDLRYAVHPLLKTDNRILRIATFLINT